MAKRKLQFEQPEKGMIAKATAKIISKLNLNTLLLAAITAWGSYKGFNIEKKQEQTQTWQAKRDSINKIMFAKQDSILTILKTKK